MPPGAVSHLGRETVDLMRSVGVTLDPGQADFMTDATSRRESGLWVAPEVVDNEPRQNGKSLLLEARALLGMLVLKEPLIIWTAHEFKTARKSFELMRAHFDNWDHLRKRVRAIRSSTAATEIILRREFGGSTLSFLARSGGSGRGFAGVAPLFMDEAFALTEEQRAAISYATSVAKNPQTWYMSSAPLKDSEVFREIVKVGRKGRRGLVYYEWSSAGKYDETLRLAERVAGLSDDDEDTPRGQELIRELMRHTAQANRAFGTRLSEETCLKQVRESPEKYLRERLGLFSDLESGAEIDYDKWMSFADPESRRDGPICLSVDVSPMRDFASIAVFGARVDGLGHAQIAYSGSPSGLIDRIVQYRDALQPMAIAMARGTYESLKEELRKRGIERPEARTEEEHGAFAKEVRAGDIAVLTALEYAAACAQMIDAVKDGTLRHVPTAAGNAAVKAARVRRRGDSMAWSTEDRAVDITPVTAMTMARWGYHARLDSVIMDDDYDVADSFG